MNVAAQREFGEVVYLAACHIPGLFVNQVVYSRDALRVGLDADAVLHAGEGGVGGAGLGVALGVDVVHGREGGEGVGGVVAVELLAIAGSHTHGHGLSLGEFRHAIDRLRHHHVVAPVGAAIGAVSHEPIFRIVIELQPA